MLPKSLLGIIVLKRVLLIDRRMKEIQLGVNQATRKCWTLYYYVTIRNERFSMNLNLRDLTSKTKFSNWVKIAYTWNDHRIDYSEFSESIMVYVPHLLYYIVVCFSGFVFVVVSSEGLTKPDMFIQPRNCLCYIYIYIVFVACGGEGLTKHVVFIPPLLPWNCLCYILFLWQVVVKALSSMLCSSPSSPLELFMLYIVFVAGGGEGLIKHAVFIPLFSPGIVYVIYCFCGRWR